MTTTSPIQVVIIGGGISGLSTAYYLQKEASAKNIPLDYTLLEKSPNPGGKISTHIEDELIIEGGPDSFITQKPWAVTLCEDLGLQDQLMGTNDDRRKTYIVHRGRLRELPDGVMLIVPTRFMPFALSPLISPWGKLRMGLDYFIPPKTDDSDESLADFIQRRLGKEALDKIAEPLMAGIYVADPSQLSLKSTFPRFITMEKKYGSLIKGMLAQQKARPTATNGANKPKRSLFMTLKGGLRQLVETLQQNLHGTLLTNQAVTTLNFKPDESHPYQIQTTAGQSLTADVVILATPAYTAANLIEPHVPTLAQKLQRIRYLSTATISLAFKRSEFTHPLNGFGFVVPKSEPCRLLACTWISTKFNHRAPDDLVLLRVFVGGYKRQELVDLTDEALLKLVQEELQAIMGIQAAPVYHRIYRWRKANAQYDVGHLERIAEIETMTAQHLPGLYLTGSAFRGVGLPDCIRQGQETAQQVMQYLA